MSFNQNWVLRNHQKFIQKLTLPNLNFYDVLFLFHGTGSGKTCSAILAAEQYSNFLIKHPDINGFIYIIGSKTSHNEFKKGLTSECGNISNLIFPDEPNHYTEYFGNDQVINKKLLNLALKEHKYKFVTYQKFISKSIEIKSFDHSLLIVDEAHSFLNQNKYYIGFKKLTEISKNYKIILMSATPMVNDPKNIVNFINIMYKKRDQVTISDLFHPITDKLNINKLVSVLKGKISYVSSYDPLNFPTRIDVGRIPNFLKYTKIIQVPMSKMQLVAYNKYYTGVVNQDIKKIIDFCIIIDGILYFTDLEFQLSKLPSTILRKNGIRITKIGKMINISGSFLNVKNIGLYSGKYKHIINDIINSPIGHTLIYSRFVHNTGIRFFGEIMKENGFDPWVNKLSINHYTSKSRHYLTNEPWNIWIQNKKNSSKKFISSKYVTIFSDVSVDDRNLIYSIFNSSDNFDGRHIKYILGSQLVKESVDFKRIKHVRILGYQDNFSRVEQIVGRAIRYKSHVDVEDPVTYVYRYVSSKGKSSELSAEELEYQKDEKNHIEIKKIERLMKMIAIDCNQNKDDYPKQNENTMFCDYTSCNYRCLFDDITFENIYNTNSKFIYNLFYHEIDYFELQLKLTKLFRINVNMTITDIILYLKDYYDEDIILDVLKKMIGSCVSFYNIHDVFGYLITDGRNVFFHPKKYSHMRHKLLLSINNRGLGAQVKLNYSTDITKFLDVERKKPTRFLNLKKDIKRLENAIKHWNSNAILRPKIYKVLKKYKYHLISDDHSKTLLNTNFDSYFDAPVRNRRNNKKFIGHILSGIPKILRKGRFKMVCDYLPKISGIPENDYYVGVSKINKLTGELTFRLKKSTAIIPFDRRKIQTGFKCTQINNKNMVTSIYYKLLDILGFPDIMGPNKKILNFCSAIEKVLRHAQFEQGDIKRWFYDVSSS